MNYKIKLFIHTLPLLGLLPLNSLQAAEKLSGCFQATQACEAFRSIRKKTNPENIHLTLEKIYPLVAKNKANAATHYQILITDASPTRRWVATECGQRLESCPKGSKSISRKTKDEYLLAVSWQPSFCETHQSKPECKTLTAKRFDAQNLSLHGLWPQPRNNAYCDVSIKDKSIDRAKRWSLLQPLELESDTAKLLAKLMPGFASNLQRHEWIKHGTCYGKDANAYYTDALSLLQEINHSSVAALFRENIGKQISSKQIRQQFDLAFGKGSGNKVNLRCDRKGRVAELWINLKGDIQSKLSLSNLLKKAPQTQSNCNSGVVDPA
ncbi:MAG TPA: ribonuclease [Leucothrix mucor]|nr:ribonuclease [Leucothrix mucor]